MGPVRQRPPVRGLSRSSWHRALLRGLQELDRLFVDLHTDPRAQCAGEPPVILTAPTAVLITLVRPNGRVHSLMIMAKELNSWALVLRNAFGHVHSICTLGMQQSHKCILVWSRMASTHAWGDVAGCRQGRVRTSHTSQCKWHPEKTSMHRRQAPGLGVGRRCVPTTTG